MKRTKRLIVAILCLALVLTSALLVVAACGDRGFSITVLSYDEQKGSVAVSPPNSGSRYRANEQVTVTVVPSQNYEVQSFKVNGTEAALQNGEYTFEITQNTAIEVTFAEADPNREYTLTFELGDHAASGQTAPQQRSLHAGETTTLPEAPEAATGFKFEGWGTEKLQPNAQFTMPAGDKKLVAQWSEIIDSGYTVTVEPTENGTVALSPTGGTYAEGTTVSITATPNSGYEIFSFLVDGAPVNYDLDGNVGSWQLDIADDVTVQVLFRQIPPDTLYKVMTRVDKGDGTISLSPTPQQVAGQQGDFYAIGTDVTVTFTPAQGYILDFFTVTGGGSYEKVVNEDDLPTVEHTFTVSYDTEIVARFEAKQTQTQLPSYYQGSWTQINPLAGHVGKLAISATEFKYDDDIRGEQTYQVVQTPNGYAYVNGNFTTPFGFVDDAEGARSVLYIHMSGSLYYLFTKDGQTPDNAFPQELRNTKWDNLSVQGGEGTMGRYVIDQFGKAQLDSVKNYLLYAEQTEEGYTLHILYNGGYWLLNYRSDDKDIITFAQPGGMGQNTQYSRLKAQALPTEYRNTWTRVGGEDTIVVDSDGYLTYEGALCDVTTASKENFDYEFVLDGNRYGMGVLSGVNLLFVLDIGHDEYELYGIEGESIPNQTVGLPESYQGNWSFTDDSGTKHTLNISNGKMTIDGAPVTYWGEESAGGESSEYSYIARAVYNNAYWDVLISPTSIRLMNIMCYYSQNTSKWALEFRREGSAGVTFLQNYLGTWKQLGGDNVIVIGSDTFTFNGTNCTGTNVTVDTYAIKGALNATISLWEEGYFTNSLLRVETNSGTSYYESGTPSTPFPTALCGKTFSGGGKTIEVDEDGSATLNGNTLRLIDYSLKFIGFGTVAGTPDTGFVYDETAKTLYIITFDDEGGFTLSDIDGQNETIFTPSV